MRRSCGSAQPLILRSAGTTTRAKHTKLLTGLPAERQRGQALLLSLREEIL